MICGELETSAFSNQLYFEIARLIENNSSSNFDIVGIKNKWGKIIKLRPRNGAEK